MTTAVESSIARSDVPNQAAGYIQLVAFLLEQEEYGIEITKVREIILPGEITRLPQTPDYIQGLIHLRGEVIPIVNLRRRFGLPDRQTTDETRIIVVNLGDKMLGIMVDAVSEVLRTSRENRVPPPPAIAGAGREYLIGLVKLNNRLLILLDIERLFGAEIESANES
jgi:purine-binding chemotaxis protein CheW